MKKRSVAAIVSAALFVMSLVTPPAYADSNSSGLSSGAQKAGSLDELRASDAQLQSAVDTLNKEVAAQQASLDAAKQAVDAADQAVAGIKASLDETAARLSTLQDAESDRAVELYMSPSGDDFVSHFLSSDGFADAAQRDALLSAINGDDYDVLDELQAAQRQFKKQQKQAVDAQKSAADRRDAEQKKLDDLNKALADQSRLEASLKARINAAAAEDDASNSGSDSDGGRASRGGDNSSDTGRASAEGLKWPVNNHNVTSQYGQRWGRMHEGIDMSMKFGEPIYAAKAGTVSYAGSVSGYGNYICVKHEGSFMTCYAHESSMEVHVGQQVDQGAEIAKAGAGGDSTGVNLHFETCNNSTAACFIGKGFHNPIDYLP